MVFDANAAPRDREEFMAWYDQQTEWSESHGYQDAAVTTPRLRAWFEEIARTFPAINGPLAGDVDDSRSCEAGNCGACNVRADHNSVVF